MSKKHLIKRILFVLAAILAAFVLQTTLLKNIPYVNIAPNLLLIVVCTFGLLCGRVQGMWIGFACGLLVDLFYGGSILGLYALVYMYIGFFNGLLSEVLLKDVVLVPMIFCFCSEIAYHGYVYVFTYLLRRRLAVLEYVKTVMLPELVLTMVFMIFLYGFLLWIHRLLTEAERKGENRIV